MSNRVGLVLVRLLCVLSQDSHDWFRTATGVMCPRCHKLWGANQ